MRFKDNICPSIDQFFQYKTYYGLLEGVPNTEINQRILDGTIAKGKQLFGIGTMHLIRPTESIQTFKSGKQMASLPKVICIAELSHYHPMKDVSKECSKLCLIWYQDNFAFPIEQSIIEEISILNWETLSEDAYL